MRAVSLLRLGCFGCLVAACFGPDAPPPAAPSAQPPPPSAFQHPGYVYYAGGQPAPQTPYMPPAHSVRDVLNMVHLQQAASQPRNCHVPREVAPGVFVHFDCYPYKRVAVAQKHASPLKLAMMRTGQIRWNPFGGGTRSNLVGGSTGGSTGGQALPDMVDHRLNGTEGPVKDQGDVGACTAFGMSTVLDNSLRRANLNITTSPEHVWSHYGIPTMEDAASHNLNKGITTYDALPYSGRESCEIETDTSDDCGQTYNVRPDTARADAALEKRLAAADASNGHRITAFEELEMSPPNIDELVSTLASGADLWVAFNVDGDAWSHPRADFTIPDWSIPNGGHSVALAGYRKVNGSYQFLVHNSWGVSWGDKGYAWVSQAMVQKWLHLAYKLKTDADAPPVQPKTDEDCAGDQVIDTVTGKCVGICPDQSRPANGQCPSGPAPAPQPLPLPGLSGWPTIPGMPAIPGWTPPAPSNPSAPSSVPAWPWPVPSAWPQFFPPPR
jgi:hypothetical protein